MKYEVPYNVKERYGFIPKSVVKLKKGKELAAFVHDSTFLRDVDNGLAKARGGGLAKKYNYSKFLPELAEYLIKFYVRDEGSWILDPFAGRGTRGLIANMLHFNYVGVDVSPITVDAVTKLFAERLENHELCDKTQTLKMILDDGCTMRRVVDYVISQGNHPREHFDSLFTCPPYWINERYEAVPKQLSEIKSYPRFIEALSKSFTPMFKLLKRSTKNSLKPFIFVVGNLRYQGRILDLVADTKKSILAAGFVQHDEIITENITPWTGWTYKRSEVLRFVSRVHEYVMVFKKI